MLNVEVLQKGDLLKLVPLGEPYFGEVGYLGYFIQHAPCPNRLQFADFLLPDLAQHLTVRSSASMRYQWASWRLLGLGDVPELFLN